MTATYRRTSLMQPTRDDVFISCWPPLARAADGQRYALRASKLAHAMKRIVLIVLFALGSYVARSQSTIDYTAGPAFPIPEGSPATIDLDRDGSPDFSFTATMPACLSDGSFCSYSDFVRPLGANELLIQNAYAVALSAGDRIGPDSPTNAFWSSGGNVAIVTWWWIPNDGTSGTNGPLATLGEGYLGVRFSGTGGVRYGWVRVRDRFVVDWAYETRLGVPIAAGAKPVPAPLAVPLASPQVVRPGYLRLKAATEAGKAYQVQTKGDLSASLWTNLSFVIPAATTNILVDLPITSAAQYFRVVEAD